MASVSEADQGRNRRRRAGGTTRHGQGLEQRGRLRVGDARARWAGGVR